MLKEHAQWAPDGFYISGSEWEPLAFFSEGLSHANSFDLLLGFFSSSAIEVLSDSFALFLYRGGNMRFVINNLLSEADRELLLSTQHGEGVPEFDLRNLRALRETLSRRDTHFFDCLAFLMRSGRLEIKVVEPKGKTGIVHTKCGVFSDHIHKISFSGSCNFSKTALIDNQEQINAFCDWESSLDNLRVQRLDTTFERIFSGEDESFCCLPVDQLRAQLTDDWPQKDMETLLKEGEQLIEERFAADLRPGVRKVLERAKHQVHQALEEQRQEAEAEKQQQWQHKVDCGLPHFPYPQGPRDYQQAAHDAWKKREEKGLFAMATGTGKTLTSLNCLLQIYEQRGYYKAIILVPTLTLLTQWQEECTRFGFERVYCISSRDPDCERRVENLALLESMRRSRKDHNYVIITTYRSFGGDRVFALLNSFPKEVLLIADECHNMGAESLLKRLPRVNMSRRIGLSATPERQFDDEANAEVCDFFGCALHDYTFTFTMREAIDQGFLCKYEYYPHLVELNADEMVQYTQVSERIARLYSADGESFLGNKDVLMVLLLQRKRIIHKASGKLAAFRQILRERYEQKGDLKYTLVYVPEGVAPESGENDGDVDEENLRLINSFTAEVQAVNGTSVRQFTASTQDREQLLNDFAEGRVQVLTSMKCLDEGVDVPRSELAIFCASTGNPRQFIQRRGRILRRHPDKEMACIHDLVVIPLIDSGEGNYNVERNLVRNELKRVCDFAMLSENMITAYNTLQRVTQHYELSLFENA